MFIHGSVLICNINSMCKHHLLPMCSSERSPCPHLQELSPTQSHSMWDFRTVTCSHSGGRSTKVSRKVSTMQGPCPGNQMSGTPGVQGSSDESQGCGVS